MGIKRVRGRFQKPDTDLEVDQQSDLKTISKPNESIRIEKEEILETAIDVIKQTRASKAKRVAVREIKPLTTKSAKFSKITVKDLSILTSQWATMAEAGLDLKTTMVVLYNQAENPKLKQIISDVYVGISEGKSISKALSKYEKDLGPYFLGMIEAGEASGLLDKNLKQLSKTLEKMAKIQAKVKSSLTYPVMIIVFAIVISFVVFQFILPQIFAVIRDMNAQLPLITVILISITDFMKTPYFYIAFFGTTIGGFIFYNNFSKTKQGKQVLDVIKIKIPIFGNIIRSYLIVSFFSTISSLIATGTTLTKCLLITKKVLNNYVFDKIIDYCIIKISEGKTLRDIFYRFVKGKYNPKTTLLSEEDKLIVAIINDVFDPMARQMISVGDETGKIDEVLKAYAEFQEEQLNRTVESISSVVEPLLIIFVGVFVGIILIAVMIPLYGMISAAD
ncbi:MAG: type II secretion system F family protein [bacterium]